MQITEIHLTNVRCWKSLKLENLNKYNVLIGENNSGKSTIINSIYKTLVSNIAFQLEDLRKQEKQIFTQIVFKLNSVSWFSHIQQLWIKERIDSDIIHLLVQNEDFWSGFKFSRTVPIASITNRTGTPTKLEYKDRIFNSINAESIKIIRSDAKFKHKNTNTINVINNINLKNEILRYLPSTNIFIPSRRNEQDETVQSNQTFNFERKGDNFKNQLLLFKNHPDTYYQSRYRKFVEIVKNLSNSPGEPDIVIRTNKSITQNNYIDLIFRRYEGNEEIVTNLRELGEGIKDIIIIIAICLANPFKVILLEEPELHLHPRSIHELKSFLKYEIDNQVFISTHNPSFIGTIDEITTVFKLKNNLHESFATQISESEELKHFRKEFCIKNSDYLFDYKMVFVEGKSDHESFTAWFELLYPDDISIQFIQCGGSTNIPTYVSISLMLQQDVQFQLFEIFDSDKGKITKKSVLEEILNKLEGHNPSLLTEEKKNQIGDSIYVLEKTMLESYFLKPKVLGLWLNISEEESSLELKKNTKQNPTTVLQILSKKYHKCYHKKHCGEILKRFQTSDVDPEIKQLFEFILK